MRGARISGFSSGGRRFSTAVSISVRAVSTSSDWRPEFNKTTSYCNIHIHFHDIPCLKARGVLVTGWRRQSRSRTRNASRVLRSSEGLWRAWRTAVPGRTVYCSHTASDSAPAALPSACAWSGSRRWWPGKSFTQLKPLKLDLDLKFSWCFFQYLFDPVNLSNAWLGHWSSVHTIILKNTSYIHTYLALQMSLEFKINYA